MGECIIICRVSTAMQGTGASLDAQESYLTEYADQHNYTIKNTLREIGSVWQGRKSSKILRKFCQVFEEAHNTIFLLLDVSRLCRCRKAGDKILKTLTSNKNKIVFVSQDLTVPKMKKQFKTQLSYAQMESDQLSRRVKLSKKYLKKKGLHTGGLAKYGTKLAYDPKLGKRVVRRDQRELSIIKFIKMCKKSVIVRRKLNKLMKNIKKNAREIECYDVDGMAVSKIYECLTYQEIADLLNSFNVKYRKRKWTKTKVSQVYRRAKKADRL